MGIKGVSLVVAVMGCCLQGCNVQGHGSKDCDRKVVRKVVASDVFVNV